jgi:UDP-N-acetylmuramoylalanine--D-glutamate ligase
MKIAILGYGQQGRSAYEYCRKPGNEITICDQNESVKLPDDVQKQLGKDYIKNLDRFDVIFRSPSVHPSDIATANSPEVLDKVTTVTNEFMKVCPTKNIVGITGTKGKGTTSTLIAKMLQAAGRHVHLGGNIGTPPLDLLKDHIHPDDWVVLELANFQLIDIKYSPHIALCLMVVPEHMDWHKDMHEYADAKQQLFRWQKESDYAIYYGHNQYSEQIASISPGRKIPYMKPPGADVVEGQIVIEGQTICKTSEIKLLGKHNWQNVCAAITAIWQITHDIEAIKSVVTTFAGLEHRLEFVREVNGAKYYDDSFGTTPETAVVAIEAFNEPKVVILGGSEKGADFTELAKVVKENNIKTAVLIGKEGPKIKKALEAAGFKDTLDGGKSMPEIVKTAASVTKPGDVVLLSTACASFDLFKNYKHRGEEFHKAVLALK